MSGPLGGGINLSMPMPVDRVVQPPNTDRTKEEDDRAERRVDDSRKAPLKEPFDAHLNRVLPPGWAAAPEVGPADMGEAIAATMGQEAAAMRPGWLLKALGDLPTDPRVQEPMGQPVALRFTNPEAHFDDQQILEAVKEKAPIHIAHFPDVVMAHIVQLHQQGEPMTRLSVAIAPEHLGQVHLAFTLKEQQVSVSVVAANQAAKDQLDQHLGAIESILKSHHFKPTELKVEVATGGQGAQGRDSSDSRDDGTAGHRGPNRWLARRGGDLDDALDVTVG